MNKTFVRKLWFIKHHVMFEKEKFRVGYSRKQSWFFSNSRKKSQLLWISSLGLGLSIVRTCPPTPPCFMNTEATWGRRGGLMWSRVRGCRERVTPSASASGRARTLSQYYYSSTAASVASSDGLHIEKEKKKSSPERRVEAIRKSSVGPPRDFEGIGM